MTTLTFNSITEIRSDLEKVSAKAQRNAAVSYLLIGMGAGFNLLIVSGLI